ncbi:MAG: EVE domain-containing protein [Myxococcota bacterium]
MKKGKGVYVDGYNRLPDGRRVWLVQAAEDAGWSWDEFLPHALSKGVDGWGGEDWIRSAPSGKRIRDEFRPGDIALCYQATPEKAVVGLARVASEGYALRRGKRVFGGTNFDFDWGCWVDPVSLDDIKDDRCCATLRRRAWGRARYSA